MSQLDSTKRANLRDSAFATSTRKVKEVDPRRVARRRARRQPGRVRGRSGPRARTQEAAGRARKYGIVPIGFVTGQLDSRAGEATAGRLVVELGQAGTAAEFERRLRTALRDPTLPCSTGPFGRRLSDAMASPRCCPPRAASGERIGWRRARAPRSADDGAGAFGRRAEDSGALKTVIAAVRLAVENDRLRGQIQAQANESRSADGQRHLPADGHRRVDGAAASARRSLCSAARRCPRRDPRQRAPRARPRGRARADEFFAVFVRAAHALEAALGVERGLRSRAWPEGVGVRVRAGIAAAGRRRS